MRPETRPDTLPRPSESQWSVRLGRLGWLILALTLARVLVVADRLLLYPAPEADDMFLAGMARRVGVWPQLID